MKKIILSLVLVTCVTFAAVLPAFAENSDTEAVSPTKYNKMMLEKRQEFNNSVQNEKKLMDESLQKEKEIMREKVKSLQEQIREKRELFKEENKEKREIFKDKLQSISDEKKQSIVEKIDERLTAINKKRTESLTQILEKLNEVLIKIETQSNELKAKGVNTAAIETAIGEAEAAIALAKTAVSDQAVGEYVAEIKDETTLGRTVSTAVLQLRNDLKKTHQVLIDARKAVRKAATELSKIKHDNPLSPTKGQNPTASPTPTPELSVTGTI